MNSLFIFKLLGNNLSKSFINAGDGTNVFSYRLQNMPTHENFRLLVNGKP